MTEKQLADGFSAFMPGDYGPRLAKAMCATAQPVTVIDDGLDASPEDGSMFAEDGSFLPGTARTAAQQHVHDYYYKDDTMLAMPGDAFIHRWVRSMLDAAGARYRFLYVSPPVQEIALAVCATTKAFPDQAAGIIQEHIINSPLYGPFWAEAQDACRPLLPESMRGEGQKCS